MFIKDWYFSINTAINIHHVESPADWGHEYEKIFKEESVELLKILGLITNIEEYNRIYNHIEKTWTKNLDCKK